MSFFKAEKVKPAAYGNWAAIVSCLAPHADEAIDKAPRHVPCPIHGGKDGFRLYKDFNQTGGGVCNTCGAFKDGFGLLMWLNDWSFKDALTEVGEFLGVEKELTWAEKKEQGNSYRHQTKDAGAIVPPQKPTVSEKKEKWLTEVQNRMEANQEKQKVYKAKLKKKISTVWSECVALKESGTDPVRKYFMQRKLMFDWAAIDESDCVRFHPALSYFNEDGANLGDFPAIVCAIRNADGELVTLHRTYLDQEGCKAPVDSAKKMMSIPDGMSVNGGAVRLGNPRDGILGVAEGLETALSAFRATHIPVWSTVNATLMESFEVPEGVHTVLIWADKDLSRTGENSANALASRLKDSGVNAYVLLPKLPIPEGEKSLDWNDMLLSQGIFGFPSAKYLRDFIKSDGGKRACN
ncbi:MAG: DUF7146 domain-containing protein [Marinomonas sp.]